MAEQETQQQPTAEEAAQAQKVGMAGAQAAATAPKGEETAAAREAMREERDRLGAPFSDQDLDKIANMFVDKMISGLEQRGVFDEPPEPVRPPETAPPAPGEAPQQTAEPVVESPTAEEAPRKKSFAERYFGL